uniref:Uncharacterized protein n=1 Tax=Phlebotomus papatasi TaxID=29031 RepID=A0A1B0DM60_PHLPP
MKISNSSAKAGEFIYQRTTKEMSEEQYLAPKRTQKRYEQRFRDAWLQNPLLKDWLRDCYSADGIREARCIYCNIRLCPRFIDLSKHAMTRKHLRNTPHEGLDFVEFIENVRHEICDNHICSSTSERFENLK